MSLQILLADFPQYSARKVRQLAKQLRYLQGLQSKEAKEISESLEKYHVLLAEHDEAKPESIQVQAEHDTEIVHVTAIGHALRAIDELVTKLREGGYEVSPSDIRSAKGIVYGDSFHTERRVIRETSTVQTNIEAG